MKAGEFPSLVAAAHELKSPLVLLRQFAYMLEGDVSEAERAIVLQRMTLTTDRALRLTTNLTKSARLDDALIELEPVNLRQLVEDVAQELSPLYTAHDKNLHVSRARRLPLVVAQRELLHQSLANLVDNALHYSADSVHVHMRRRGADTVRVGIRDYGTPVSSAVLKRMRLGTPQSMHARPQSSGLGLYLAAQFAACMHATVGVVRHRDGNTFYIDMPVSEQLSLL